LGAPIPEERTSRGAAAAPAGERVATARESNAVAARLGLWDALDTLRCGKADVVRAFLASVEPGGRIVDVGCWNGSIAALAAESNAGGRGSGAPWRSYVGVDVVPEAVARFEARNAALPRTAARLGDVRDLPLADGSADVVLCLFVLQDLESRAAGVRALAELARVARPGARALLALTVHASRDEETFYVVRKLRAEGIPEKPTYHWRREDFVAAVRDTGFRIDRVDEFGPNERGFVELYLDLVRDQGDGEGGGG
jgi:SAM-dependent methyltransferase